MIDTVYRSSCKGPVIIVRFSWNLNFLDIFSKNISNFMEIRPVGAKQGSMRTDKYDKANCRSSPFCESA